MGGVGKGKENAKVDHMAGRLVEMLTCSLAFQQNPQSLSRELIAFIQALMAGRLGGGTSFTGLQHNADLWK